MHLGEVGSREIAVAAVPLPGLRQLRRTRRQRLPDAPGALLGRQADLDTAGDLLLTRSTRLLTLVGPPGVGKTRLALAIGEAIQADFEQGAAFVDLSSVRSPDQVLETVAQTFGLRQQGSLKPADQLEAHLREAAVLLVLDNLEHLLEVSADLGRLLAQSPGLVILATSRTALQLRWERVYDVPPLAPAASVELFVDRARARRADFISSDADVPVLAEICSRLDGLPLAIELAAARCMVLSPHDILARLAPRLELLTGGARDASARHQTLRHAIDWSYDLLTDDERSLLRRLSTFVGSFSVEAAEAVAAPPGEAVIERLSSLVGKSLVRFEPTSASTQSRFRLLETIREYAHERLLLEGEALGAHLRHAEHFRGVVEQEYPRNFGPDQPAFAARLERDYPNLRAALKWALDSGHVELALRLGAGLHWFWYSRGQLVEGTRWLDQALAQAHLAPPAARAAALRAAGALNLNQGKFGVAIDQLEAAVALGVRRSADVGARSELAMALGILGVAQIAAGRYDAAEGSIRESLAIFEALADEWGIATANEVLAAIAALRGDADAADALASDALEVHRRLGSRENIARALDVLGYAAALRGELAKATACFEESLVLRRATPNRPGTAAVLAHLGLVAYLGRNWERAASLYRESLALAQEIGDTSGVVRCLGQVAALALACGVDRRRVARLGSAVQHHHAALGLPSPPVEQIAAKRLAAALRADLSPVGLAAAWVGGRMLGLDQAATLGGELLDRIAVPAESTSATPGGLSLTRRETEVATLVAQGLTNRQIAEEFGIAQRTVDTHVERTLAKLGFAARAQVGVWVASRGLLPPDSRER